MYLIFCYVCYCFTAITVVLITLFLIVCKVINGYWERKGAFTLKPKIFFGNAQSVIFQKRSLGEEIKEFYDKLNSNGVQYGGYYFLMRPILVISDLELIKRMLVTDCDHFTDHSMYVNEANDPLTGNLFALKGEKWKKLRVHLSSAYNTKTSKVMFDTLLSCCKEMEMAIDNKVKSGEVVDIVPLLCDVNMAILLACTCQMEFNNLKHLTSTLHHYCSSILHSRTTWDSIVKAYSEELTNFFVSLVNDIVHHRQANNIIRKDLIGLLIQLKSDKELTLNHKEIAAQLFLFLAAGHETTSLTPAFCIYELCINQCLQDKIRDEISLTLLGTNGVISFDDLSKMKYVDQCIYETFRKYPTMVVHSRVCTKTYVIPNTHVTVTKGTPVLIPTYGIHMDPRYFPNPEIYDPERFSEHTISDRPSCSFLPFGVGPRTCIAYKFGLVQVKLVLITLLRRYKFSLHASTNVPLEHDPKHFMIYPSTPILLYVERIV
ncbi:probable cytochrome P450 6a23 isoform X2 [Photinus pyralis]|uniref:probable cytochrome P450 6a23 isoform X2 n=1 Tax=Photinus pyralis TaxID=7054 RepID=UPI0012670875|nr:probable cytochrome P450 6a23 isoform X2 [Photinus pyralis]